MELGGMIEKKHTAIHMHDPSDNADMISEAFWLQRGSEFKITKSDD